MNKLRYLTLALFALHSARATTVIPPTFEQLVSQAEFIFQGTVTEVKSMWSGEATQRHIQTYVTFKIDDAIKGEPGATYTIGLLGGTVDGETMEVSDTPKFKVGDRDVLFVEHNGEQFVPLVGINYGRFHVQQDAQSQRDFVSTGENQPLADVAKLGHGEQTAVAAKALSPDQFKSAIRAELSKSPR
jgi:hypothetical protein